MDKTISTYKYLLLGFVLYSNRVGGRPPENSKVNLENGWHFPNTQRYGGQCGVC